VSGVSGRVDPQRRLASQVRRGALTQGPGVYEVRRQESAMVTVADSAPGPLVLFTADFIGRTVRGDPDDSNADVFLHADLHTITLTSVTLSWSGTPHGTYDLYDHDSAATLGSPIWFDTSGAFSGDEVITNSTALAAMSTALATPDSVLTGKSTLYVKFFPDPTSNGTVIVTATGT
jgi:hypothetical protein